MTDGFFSPQESEDIVGLLYPHRPIAPMTSTVTSGPESCPAMCPELVSSWLASKRGTKNTDLNESERKTSDCAKVSNFPMSENVHRCRQRH